MYLNYFFLFFPNFFFFFWGGGVQVLSTPVHVVLTRKFENANLNFKMLSLNVRGFRALEKRKALLIRLGKQNADIIFLQETYSTKDVENIWKSQWKEPMIFAHGSNRSCGVLVLVKNSLEFELKSTVADENGRYILLDVTVQGSNYFMGNVYAPNKTQKQCSFFDKLLQELNNLVTGQNQRIIIGGDFNDVRDLDLDSSGGSPKENMSAKVLDNICLNYDLIDIWRIRNPESKFYLETKEDLCSEHRQPKLDVTK